MQPQAQMLDQQEKSKQVEYVKLSKTEKICDWVAGILIAAAGIGLGVFFVMNAYDPVSSYLFLPLR